MSLFSLISLSVQHIAIKVSPEPTVEESDMCATVTFPEHTDAMNPKQHNVMKAAFSDAKQSFIDEGVYWISPRMKFAALLNGGLQID